jgi:hypothetical protein
MEAQPISINDYDDIAGNYPVDNTFNGFARSTSGVYDDILLDRGTGARAINSNGSVIGYNTEGEDFFDGYVWHPDGWSSLLIVPIPPQSAPDCYTSTFPEGINATGTIVGWYNTRCNPVNTGFVLSLEMASTPHFRFLGRWWRHLCSTTRPRIRIGSALTRLGISQAPTRTRLGPSTLLYATPTEPSRPSIRRKEKRPLRPPSAMEARSPVSITTRRAVPLWALSAYRNWFAELCAGWLLLRTWCRANA